MSDEPLFTWDDVSTLYAVATLCRKGSPLAHKAAELDSLADRIASRLEVPRWDGDPVGRAPAQPVVVLDNKATS